MTGDLATFYRRALAWLPPVLVLGLLIAAGCGDKKIDPTYPDPHQPQVGNWFFGIWGLNESHIFVVGQPGLIYHFDGTEWHREDSGTNVALTDVWGDGTGTVYATGHQGVILRRSPAGAWSSMESGTTNPLYSVGRHQGTVMASGFKGTLRRLVGQSWVGAPELIYRYGEGAVIEDTLILSRHIKSLTAVAHHGIGGLSGILMQDQLADWQLRLSSQKITCAVSNADRIDGNFAATDDGRLFQLQMAADNQPVWRERYSPALDAIVYGIYADEGDTVWAVTNDGRINRVAPPHLLEDSFTELYSDELMVFFDIWGSSATNIYAVGINGLVLRYHEVDDEYGWHREDLPDMPETKSLSAQIFDKFGRPVHR